jgi:hypothetical protein
MSDPSAAGRLTAEEILAVKFASYRQLARWASTPKLSPEQRAKRDALKRAVTVFNDHAYTQGCQLQPLTRQDRSDA